jgi:hypothetical protein
MKQMALLFCVPLLLAQVACNRDDAPPTNVVIPKEGGLTPRQQAAEKAKKEREALYTRLKVTAEQRPKVDAAFVTAEKAGEALIEAARKKGLDQQAMMGVAVEASEARQSALAKELKAILTSEQYKLYEAETKE